MKMTLVDSKSYYVCFIEEYRGGSRNSSRGAGSSKRQGRRNFETDKQKYRGGGAKPPNPLDPPLEY